MLTKYYLPNGKAADTAAFLALAREADYVLLGEAHASACDHAAQTKLLSALSDASLFPVLGLEMVAVDKQDVLDRFNAGELTAEDLKEALDWPTTWGHPFEFYLPVLEAAEARSVPLYALNIPIPVVRQVSAKGIESLSDDQCALLPDEIIPPREDQKALLEEEFKRHLAMFEDAELDENSLQKRLERFFLIQSLWDSAMAQALVRVQRDTGRPVAVLVGSGHVEYGWGLKHRLASLAPQGKVLLVVPWRGTEPLDPAAGDFFFHCPLMERARLGVMLEWQGDDGDGALVLDVEPGSRAESGGVQKGDVILKAMGMPLTGLITLHQAGRQAASQNIPLVLTIRRGDQTLDLDIALPDSKPDDKAE